MGVDVVLGADVLVAVAVVVAEVGAGEASVAVAVADAGGDPVAGDSPGTCPVPAPAKLLNSPQRSCTAKKA